MKIKRMVKRLFAVGTGVAMLGATAMGAMAANLNEYPNMFVDNGRFNGFLVVGEAAQAVDNLAMTDIAANMKVAKAGGGSSSSSVTGDSWLVATSSKKLEMANSNTTDSSIKGETFRDINTFIGKEELGALKDGTWSTNENDYGFQQFLFFDPAPSGDNDVALHEQNRIVKYTESDSDVTADHLYFKNSRQIARYKLEFTSNAQSDVTDATGTASTTGIVLDDFENTDLSFMGSEYTVVLARRTTSGSTAYQNGAKLTLMSGSSRDTLLEGESRTYTNGKTYDVELVYVDATDAKFVVNGQATNKLKVGETFTLADKSEIGVSEVLYQAYAGGVHSATFFVGANKLVLQDDDVSAVGGEKKMKLGSEDIDGSLVIITGSDDNVTFSISTIEVNMTSDDDFFVPSGSKLSDVIAAAGEEKEVLMGGAFDIEYLGLTGEATRDLRLKSSSSKRYRLSLYDGDNNPVDIPIAYADTTDSLNVSEDSGQSSRTNQKRLIWEKSLPVHKNDYLILRGGTQSDGSAKSYLLQYRGADKSTDTSPKISFKNMGSGESLEYSATSTTAIGGTIATIKLGGYSFPVQSLGSDQTSDDYAVRVALDTTAISTDGTDNNTRGDVLSFVDAYGSEWKFNVTPRTGIGNNATIFNEHLGGNVTGILVEKSTPNSDDYDNIQPGRILLNISATAGPEVRAAFITTGTVGGFTAQPLTLVTPDGETEVTYGYTTMGTFITFNEPSGDPDGLTLSYPEKQRLPQVYFTSGSTTSATSTSSGNLVAVEVVDATKLDSEVASVSAQNLIVVGGPCVNTVAAELMGNPTDCAAGFTPGKARVKLFEHTNGNTAMLVAGYSGADTRLAGKVIANRPGELSGTEVEIEGTTASSATVKSVGSS
jgi:hypothetical protein